MPTEPTLIGIRAVSGILPSKKPEDYPLSSATSLLGAQAG